MDESIVGYFKGFPLTGLIAIQTEDEHDEIALEDTDCPVAYPAHREWFAIVRRPIIGPDGRAALAPAERIVIDPRIIAELRNDHHFVDCERRLDPLIRIERELNAAAERVAGSSLIHRE